MTSALALKRPRPRWKTYLISHQNLRFFRTSLLGRMPGSAGALLRSVLTSRVPDRRSDSLRMVQRRVQALCVGDAGLVKVDLRFKGAPGASAASLLVANQVADMEISHDGEEVVVRGSLQLGEVGCWWPRTHGDQPLYDVGVEIDGVVKRAGRVGFRTVDIDRSRRCDWQFRSDGVEIFCRGAVWMPPDPVSMAAGGPAEVRRMVELARAART